MLFSIVSILALGGIAGFFIGCIGIGGVLLVPGLTFGGIEIHDAIAASLFSYIFCAAAAVWIFARAGSIEWSSARTLCLSAMPAAFAGAIVAAEIRAGVLEAIVALTLLLSGVRALTRSRAGADERRLSRNQLLVVGAITGFGSALTGTGGPFVLVPILVWFEMPILMVVGLSQAIQIPISLLATLGNYFYGHIDFRLGLLLAGGLLAGTVAGALAAHRISAPTLRRLAGIVMLAAGGLFVVRYTQQFAW